MLGEIRGEEVRENSGRKSMRYGKIMGGALGEMKESEMYKK